MPDTGPRKSSRWPARSSPTPEQPNTIKVYPYIAFLQYTTPEIRGDYALEGKAIVVGAFRHGASWNQVAGAAAIDLADVKRRWGTWPAAQPAKRASDGRGRSWWTGRACIASILDTGSVNCDLAWPTPAQGCTHYGKPTEAVWSVLKRSLYPSDEVPPNVTTHGNPSVPRLR